MVIAKDELRSLIPHSGDMCLLDTVEHWDDESILCSSATHLDRDNPLRRGGRLGAIHGMEYGAQAAAVHGALLTRDRGETTAPAYLAALRDVHLGICYLDDVQDRLAVRAALLSAGGGNQIYTVSVSAGGKDLVSGRVVVMAVRT